MNIPRRLLPLAVILAALFPAASGLAQSGPPMPPMIWLDSYSFLETNLDSDFGYAPLKQTNALIVQDCWGNALMLDTTNLEPSFLNYPVTEANGRANIDLAGGALFASIVPDWASADTNQNGQGPGEEGFLLAAGDGSPGSPQGLWAVYVDAGGTNIYFAGLSNSVANIYVSAPISWSSNSYHEVAVTYSTNSALYLDGQFAASGGPVTIVPATNTWTNGFFIGSDSAGYEQFRGIFLYLEFDTTNAVVCCGTNYFTSGWAWDSNDYDTWAGAQAAFHSDNGMDRGFSPLLTNESPSYIDSQFWLEALPRGTNAYNSDSNAVTFILYDTTNTASYQLQTKASLTDANWTPRQVFAGADGQNWTPLTFSMSGQTTLFFRAINYSQDTTESGLPDWWKLQNGLNPGSLASGTNGVSDAYANPAGDGWTDLQKFQNGMNINSFYTPPPLLVTIAALPNGHVLISWEPALGLVTGYVVRRIGSDITGTLPNNQTSYEDDSVFVSPSAATLPSYQVVAQYSSPSGTQYSSVSIPQFPTTASMAVSVALLRGPKGQYYLAAPNLPNTVTNLRIFLQPAFSEYPNILFDIYSQPMTNFNSTATASYHDFPANSFVNGMCPVPQSFLPNYNSLNLTCVTMGANGTFGPATPVTTGFFQYVPQSADWYNYELSSVFNEIGGYWGNALPFLDGTAQLRQNLIFQLESADQLNALQFSVEAIYPDPRPSIFPVSGSSDVFFLNNYAWANFHVRNGGSVALVNEFKPFEDNYFYRNLIAHSSGDLNSDGSLASGVFYAGGGPMPPPPATPYESSYYVQIPNEVPYAFPVYAYAASGSTNPPSPLLSTNAQSIFSTWPDYGNIGASYNDSWGLTLAGGQSNIFGLPYQSLTEYYSDGVTLYSQTYNAGQTLVDVGASNGYDCFYYPQVGAPQLHTVGYYFGMDNRDYLPGDPGFTPATGTAAPIIATPGVPLLIGAWAEQSVNGSTNTPGFLEQYFDNSYSWNFINGNTTNQLGVLSEYGEFFPTDPGMAVLTTKTNLDGTYGVLQVPVIGLYVDRNHDGVMDTRFSGPDFCTPARPFRFWVNDDNDSGDTGGDDIPNYNALHGMTNNGLTKQVNGSRDLVDFFPVYVDIKAMLEATNLGYLDFTYRLSQADGALNYFITTLDATNPIAYLTDPNALYANRSVTQITSNGVVLGYDYFNSIIGGGGIILVEARTNSTAPLVLDVMSNGYIFAEAQLPLDITGVEQMFRHINLTPAVLSQIDGPPNRLTPSDVTNAPDDNGTNFLFVHGYNVSPNQARGWESEMFKRMYWSGSHARFYGVTWRGYESQGTLPTPIGTVSLPTGVSPNLQTNVANAFLTAPYLAAFVDSLNGPNIVAAHSLGNMLVLSAINDYSANIQSFFMVDAAVAMEAIDSAAFPNTAMIDSRWLNYSNSLYSAYWHNLFTNTDYRGKLTWTGRLAQFHGAQVYNFYSSGEEVLRSWEYDPPTNILSSVEQIIADYYYSHSPPGSYTWVWQEKSKGIAANNAFLGSDHGGWKFNTNYSSLTVAQANALSPAQLKTNAFFDFGSADFANDYAVEGSLGNVYAYQFNNRMLADAIPALSFPVGANHVAALAPQGQPDRNTDMMTLQNGWPSSRPSTGLEARKWYHSDCKVMSYTYTVNLFTQISSLGNLK